MTMMKRGCDLDQALQECFFRLGFDEPYLFPELVSLEEFLRVEVREPLFEFLFPLC